MVSAPRVAILGGDAHTRVPRVPGWEVRRYYADRPGGNGELKRLLHALRGGRVERLVILTRWVGHAAAQRAARAARARGVRVSLR